MHGRHERAAAVAVFLGHTKTAIIALKYGATALQDDVKRSELTQEDKLTTCTRISVDTYLGVVLDLVLKRSILCPCVKAPPSIWPPWH